MIKTLFKIADEKGYCKVGDKLYPYIRSVFTDEEKNTYVFHHKGMKDERLQFIEPNLILAEIEKTKERDRHNTILSWWVGGNNE
jgi:hypothetical protein